MFYYYISISLDMLVITILNSKNVKRPVLTVTDKLFDGTVCLDFRNILPIFQLKTEAL